jgi:dTDP-4-amino-4,6-dideoxygalactose transaminase
MTHRFNIPYVAGKEMRYLAEVVESRQFAGNGPFTKRIHRLLEDRYELPHVLLTHSCTGALELAALALDLGPGDEVIVPSYTFCSTAAAFLRTGASIVFCEVDPATMNLDARDALARMTDRTRAIVPVHYGGISAEMAPILKAARARGVAVVEDAAQGLEAKLGDRWLGTLGDMGTVSFHETKNLHSGLGGALFVNRADLFERAEDMWERGTNRAKMFKGLVDKYSWVELGSSFYPSELQAAFLLAQLESVDRNLEERQAIYERYRDWLAPRAEAGDFALPTIPGDRTINFHSFFIIAHSVEDADRLRISLVERDIHAYIGYIPLHSSPMGRRLGYSAQDLPVTEEYAPRVLRLPFHNELTLTDVDAICQAICEYYGS